jgi:hypothetical protein
MAVAVADLVAGVMSAAVTLAVIPAVPAQCWISPAAHVLAVEILVVKVVRRSSSPTTVALACLGPRNTHLSDRRRSDP